MSFERCRCSLSRRFQHPLCVISQQECGIPDSSLCIRRVAPCLRDHKFCILLRQSANFSRVQHTGLLILCRALLAKPGILRWKYPSNPHYGMPRGSCPRVPHQYAGAGLPGTCSVHTRDLIYGSLYARYIDAISYGVVAAS